MLALNYQMTVPMLRILPPPWDFLTMSAPSGSHNATVSFNSNKYDSTQRLGMVPMHPPRNPNKPFTSFRINDILNSNGCNDHSPPQTHKQSSSKVSPSHMNTLDHRNVLSKSENYRNNQHKARSGGYCIDMNSHDSQSNNGNNHSAAVPPGRIVRPWDTSPPPGKAYEASSETDDEEINVDDDDDNSTQAVSGLKDVSPLDALMEMANKTFHGLETLEADDAKRREQTLLFGGKNSTPKKRRKSRTAFTNQQIYELEKRFIYQKYLTPADRDEIAQNLGLTNAQVITWFQNRRAKLKRDLEELKNDVVATKQLSIKSGSSDHEFSIDSDSDSAFSGSRSSNSPPKQCRNGGRSPEHGRANITEIDAVQNGTAQRNESPDEIMVDDREDNGKDFLS